MCLSARFTKFLKMGDHRDVIHTLFALMANVMKTDVTTPHSTVRLNQELMKSQPEEVVTKDVGLKADAMTPNSIVSLNQELINSHPEEVVLEEVELKGLEQDGVNFEVMTREKKRTANLMPSGNSEEELTTSITHGSSTQTHCDNKRIRTRPSPEFEDTTVTPPRKDVMTRMTAGAVIKASKPNLAESTSMEILAMTQTKHEVCVPKGYLRKLLYFQAKSHRSGKTLKIIRFEDHVPDNMVD